MAADLFRQLLKNCPGPAKRTQNSGAAGRREPKKTAEFRQLYVFFPADFQFQVAKNLSRFITREKPVVA
jgi:hypothetical protein